MAEIVFTNVLVKMEENVIHAMAIASVRWVLLVIDVNRRVHRERMDICVCKNVNVAMMLIVILEQVR